MKTNILCKYFKEAYPLYDRRSMIAPTGGSSKAPTLLEKFIFIRYDEYSIKDIIKLRRI